MLQKHATFECCRYVGNSSVISSARSLEMDFNNTLSSSYVYNIDCTLTNLHILYITLMNYHKPLTDNGSIAGETQY